MFDSNMHIDCYLNVLCSVALDMVKG